MSKEKKNGLGKFLAGAAIGAGLGLLFAPKKGSELRKDLKNKLDEIVGKAKEIDVEEVKNEFFQKVDEVKKGLEDLDKEKVLKIAKQKAKKIQKKAEELYKLAIEKGTPALEKSTKELKEATANALKKIVAKLESE